MKEMTRIVLQATGFIGSLALGVSALVILLLSSVSSHQIMGKASETNLFGHRIGGKATETPINCCRYAPGGDCREVNRAQVVNVEGGTTFEGEFIPASEITVSPRDSDGESRFWICKSKGSPAHCAFSPSQGT